MRGRCGPARTRGRLLLLLLLLALQVLGIFGARPAYEQLLPILKGDAAAVGLGLAALGLEALDVEFRADFQGPLGETAPQHDVGTAAFHHPVGDLAVLT